VRTGRNGAATTKANVVSVLLTPQPILQGGLWSEQGLAERR